MNIRVLSRPIVINNILTAYMFEDIPASAQKESQVYRR